MAKYMIENGANVNKRDTLGKPPIYYAVHRRNAKIVSCLLEHNVKLAIYNPIYIASRLGTVNIFKALLERSDCHFDSREVIYQAAMKGHTQLLQCFYDHCMKTERPFHINFDDFNDDEIHKNPLYFAVKGHHNNTALFLISKGANVNRKKSLHYAVRNPNSEDIAVAMINAGADLTFKDSFKVAILGGRSKTVTAMLEGLNNETINNFTPPNSCDHPLYLAARRGHYNVFKTLLNHPATEPNAKSQYKPSLSSSAIHVISRGNKQSMVRMMKRLLKTSTAHLKKKKGGDVSPGGQEIRIRIIDVNVQNKDGNTALHIAMLSPYARTMVIVRMLLCAGADYTIENKERKTPVDYAFNEKKKEQFEKWIEKIEKQKLSGPDEELQKSPSTDEEEPGEEEMMELEKPAEVEEYFVPAPEPEVKDSPVGKDHQNERIESPLAMPEQVIVDDPDCEDDVNEKRVLKKKKRYTFMVYHIDTTSEEEDDDDDEGEEEEEEETGEEEEEGEGEDEVIKIKSPKMKSPKIRRQKKKKKKSLDEEGFGFENDIDMNLSNSMSMKDWKFMRKKVKNLKKRATAQPSFWRSSKARDRARMKLRLMFKRTGRSDRNVRGEVDYMNGKYRNPFDDSPSGSPFFNRKYFGEPGTPGSPKTPVFMGKKVKIKLDVKNQNEAKKVILNRLREKAFGKEQGGLNENFLGNKEKKKKKKKRLPPAPEKSEGGKTDSESESSKEEEEEEEVEEDEKEVDEGTDEDDEDDEDDIKHGRYKTETDVKEEEEDVVDSPIENEEDESGESSSNGSGSTESDEEKGEV